MRWIVVDGIDGSGKSTCAHWIKDHYSSKGEKVLVRIHPSGSWAGRVSRKALEGEGGIMRLMATAFFILDVLDSVRRLRIDRKQQDTVVFVRYLMAAAYLPESLAPRGYDFFAKLLPVPERLILVDVGAETAHARIVDRQNAREMFEDVESLRKVRRKVLALAQRGGWRVLDNEALEEQAKASLISVLEEWDSAPSSSAP
jgi:dTMP kinase